MTGTESGSPRERQVGTIGAVANALELLQLFAGGREIHVNRASRTLGLSRSTIHRLLATLSVYGYVEQDPMTRTYRPGPALTGIGLAAVQSSDLRTMARPAVAHLARATGETTHLMILRGDHVLCVDSIESDNPVRTGRRIGWNMPTHATAGGRALLAELDDREIASIYPVATIGGGRVAVRVIDLLADLELVRARGYATNFGQTEPDVSAVAVVLRDRLGQARAAMSVTAPRIRGDEGWARTVGRIAVTIAAQYRGTVP